MYSRFQRYVTATLSVTPEDSTGSQDRIDEIMIKIPYRAPLLPSLHDIYS